MDTAWIALIGTVFGGAGLKLMESFLARGSKQVDTATAMREELRKESASLKEELRAVEKELDLWKEKYFTLMTEYLEIKSQVAPTTPTNRRQQDW